MAVARQAPLSMGFSRREYWSGLPYPPPGDLPHPGSEPASLTSSASAGTFFATSTTWEAHRNQGTPQNQALPQPYGKVPGSCSRKVQVALGAEPTAPTHLAYWACGRQGVRHRGQELEVG
ncbi:unnamed protein product [Rangifer tarandus platyrhynchus]|uniref:Uncharacterized protein n=1 Tax=Rangifer tarandus platyrhynchus TaxID=3082113 RepID=A0ABN8ZI55_RANTA|nr:unnamed protein product [Rangifer tarandus platyrhynchus]